MAWIREVLTGREKNKPLVIIGTTRFSVDPSSIIRDRRSIDLDKARLIIYDSNRLRQKLALFKIFALPGLLQAARRYSNFYHIVAFSELLPIEFRKELAKLVSHHGDWIRLLEVAPTSSLVEMVRGAVHALGNGRPTLSFRLDDDDAICPDFVYRLEEHCRDAPDGTILSFDIGYYLQRISESSYVLEARDYPKVAIGLGVYRENGLGGCIFDLPVHTKIPSNTVLNIRDEVMWIRTIHEQNDSGKRVASQSVQMSLEEVQQSLHQRFHFLPLKEAISSLPITDDRSPLASRILFRIQ